MSLHSLKYHNLIIYVGNLLLKLHIDLFQFLNMSLIRIFALNCNCFVDIRCQFFITAPRL